MSYPLAYAERCTRMAARFLKLHSEMTHAHLKTLALPQLNPYHPSPRLHPLGGRLKGVHSVSINLSCWINLHPMLADKDIVPLDVGDRDAVCRC